MSQRHYHTTGFSGRGKRGALPCPSGTIDVDAIVFDAWADAHQEFVARMKRQTERYEESQVLREWWQATEKDRPEIVRRNQDVFDRIHRNRKEAARIEAEERQFQDQRMRAAGYLVRQGRIPRYVRPERKEARHA